MSTSVSGSQRHISQLAAAPVGRRRWLLAAVEAFTSLAAIYGGFGLMANNSIGMKDEWLDGTWFESWTLPGLFLLLVVAIPMGIAAVAEASRRPWAYWASLLAGAAQVGWIVVQWAVLRQYFFLQPVMLAIGLIVILLAWWVRAGRVRHDAR